MMNFSWAHDLDPKGTNNHIKEAIDKLQGSDDIGGFSRRDGKVLFVILLIAVKFSFLFSSPHTAAASLG